MFLGTYELNEKGIGEGGSFPPFSPLFPFLKTYLNYYVSHCFTNGKDIRGSYKGGKNFGVPPERVRKNVKIREKMKNEELFKNSEKLKKHELLKNSENRGLHPRVLKYKYYNNPLYIYPYLLMTYSIFRVGDKIGVLGGKVGRILNHYSKNLHNCMIFKGKP